MGLKIRTLCGKQFKKFELVILLCSQSTRTPRSATYWMWDIHTIAGARRINTSLANSIRLLTVARMTGQMVTRTAGKSRTEKVTLVPQFMTAFPRSFKSQVTCSRLLQKSNRKVKSSLPSSTRCTWHHSTRIFLGALAIHTCTRREHCDSNCTYYNQTAWLRLVGFEPKRYLEAT